MSMEFGLCFDAGVLLFTTGNTEFLWKYSAAIDLDTGLDFVMPGLLFLLKQVYSNVINGINKSLMKCIL